MPFANNMIKQKFTLLLIDDKPSNSQILVDTLRDYGFVIITALNGKDGLQIAQQEQPDLILLEVMMPSMDGFDTCRCLKANAATQQMPVIFFTGLNHVENKVKGFSVGGIDYITKPITEPQEILARLTAHLNQYRLQQHLVQRLQAYEQHFGPLNLDASGAQVSDQKTPHHQIKQRVWQARDKLLSNLTCTPSLDELARAVGTNRNTLSKEFNVLFGMSVFAWLREQRLQEANRLLCETDWSIQKISDTVGYTDSNHFSTGFKRRFSKSPRQHRKINCS